MGMVHCYRCSLPGHYAVLRNLYLLYLLTVTLIFLYVKELPFSTFSSLTDSTILIPEWS